jgi:hypothetical protein
MPKFFCVLKIKAAADDEYFKHWERILFLFFDFTMF